MPADRLVADSYDVMELARKIVKSASVHPLGSIPSDLATTGVTVTLAQALLDRSSGPVEQGWIPVAEDSLPRNTTGEDVLVLSVRGKVRVEVACEVVGLWKDAQRYQEKCAITHWRPVPDHPSATPCEPLTREEVIDTARALFQHYGWNNPGDLTMRNRIERMRDMALSSRSETGWIACDERQPPCANKYLAASTYPDGEKHVQERYFNMAGKWDGSFVTHWMPLPEAPQ